VIIVIVFYLISITKGGGRPLKIVQWLFCRMRRFETDNLVGVKEREKSSEVEDV